MKKLTNPFSTQIEIKEDTAVVGDTVYVKTSRKKRRKRIQK